MRALIVDDNEDIRYLIAQLLRREGFDIAEAAHGLEALRVLGRMNAPPAVVVLDVQMPVMDGWDALESIRRDPATAEIPVVMCTVKGRVADLVRGWELGCDGFVNKPFNIDDLVAEVTAAAKRSLPERQKARREGLAHARRLLAEFNREAL